MDPKEVEKRIIENYQNDERLMVLVFCQWCVNHGLDPQALYEKAYPEQPNNELIEKMKEDTVPKEEAEDISDAAVLHILEIFGNHDLAFVVQAEIDKRKHAWKRK